MHEHEWAAVDNYGFYTGYFHCLDLDCPFSLVGRWVWEDQVPEEVVERAVQECQTTTLDV